MGEDVDVVIARTARTSFSTVSSMEPGSLGITERSAYGIVTDLTEGGYIVKEREEKDGRRNRYQIQTHLPLREGISRERTIGEILDLLVDTNTLTERRGGRQS